MQQYASPHAGGHGWKSESTASLRLRARTTALAAGDNSLIASGSFPGGAIEDKVQWHLSDAAAKSTYIDCGALVAGASPEKRFGSDTFFEGGTAQMISGAATGRGRPAPPPVISGTDSPEVAATYRMGSLAIVFRHPTDRIRSSSHLWSLNLNLGIVFSMCLRMARKS